MLYLLAAAAGSIVTVKEGGGEAWIILTLLYWPLGLFVGAMAGGILHYLHMPDPVAGPIIIVSIVVVGLGVWASVGAGLQSLLRRLRTKNQRRHSQRRKPLG